MCWTRENKRLGMGTAFAGLHFDVWQLPSVKPSRALRSQPPTVKDGTAARKAPEAKTIASGTRLGCSGRAGAAAAVPVQLSVSDRGCCIYNQSASAVNILTMQPLKR